MGTGDFQLGACCGPQCPDHRLCRHQGAGCQRRRGQRHALGKNTGGTDVACGMRDIALRTKIGPIATGQQDRQWPAVRPARGDVRNPPEQAPPTTQTPEPYARSGVGGGLSRWCDVAVACRVVYDLSREGPVTFSPQRSGKQKGGATGTAPVHGKGPDQNPALINSNVSAIRSRSSLLVGNCARIGTSISSRPEATRSSSVTSAFNAAALAEP